MEYFRRFTSGRGQAASAGTRVTVPGEAIGGRDDAQVVLEAMHEDDIDMSANTRTIVTPELLHDFDKVVVMAEPDRIPEWLRRNPKFMYWETRNVNGLPLEEVRAVRDQIKAKVEALINQNQ